MAFLHGISVVERTGGLAPIRSAPTGIIGLVGTAGMGPVNVPTLVAGNRSKRTEVFGGDGTIPDALDAIFAQVGAVVVVVNVFDPTPVNVAEAEYAFDGDTLDLPGEDVSNVVVKNQAGDKFQASYYAPSRTCDTSFGCCRRSRNRFPGWATGSGPVGCSKSNVPLSSARTARSTPWRAKRLAVAGCTSSSSAICGAVNHPAAARCSA